MLNKVIISRKVYTYCTRFIQVGTLVFTIQTQATNLSLFKAFNPRVKAKSVSRTPQSYYADVNYSPKPEDYKTVIDYVFVNFVKIQNTKYKI